MLDSNPYAPPTTESAPSTPHLEDATRMRRFFGWFIDLVTLNLIGTAYVFIAVVVRISVFHEDSTLVVSDYQDHQMLGILRGVATSIIYYIVLESLFQRTVGKMILGTRVVTTGGHKPNLKTILIRTVLRFVPFEGFTFLTPGDGFHDTRSNTAVKRRATSSETP